jgi:VanZ family protein
MKWFSIRFFLRLFFLTTLCFCLASSSWAQSDGFSQSEDDQLLIPEKMTPSEEKDYFPPEPKTPSEKGESLPPAEEKVPLEKKKEVLTRGQKTLLLNGGSVAAILVYGLLQWDYGESNFNFENEGWFQHDTKYGGADKLGHFWTSYALSHLYSYIYRKWGYSGKEANLYGSLSSLGVNAFMELADGFSPSQGFSYEDMIMNILGCGAGYIWGKYPNLARKIDFRIEYTPEFNSDDLGIATNYERHRFLIAIKADGFEFVKNRYLKYLELHGGYYAHNYEDYEVGGPDDRKRYLYVGIGFNVSRLLQKFVNTRVFDYLQIPYTSVRKDFPLD